MDEFRELDNKSDNSMKSSKPKSSNNQNNDIDPINKELKLENSINKNNKNTLQCNLKNNFR